MVDLFKFTEQVNLLHPTALALLAMKFTTEISDTETALCFRPGWIPRHSIQRKMRKSYIIDVKTHFKRKPPVDTFSPLITLQLLKRI